MATNGYRRFLLALLLFAGVAPFLRAQNEDAQSAGYFIDTEKGEPRFIQRLVWAGGEYALRYEVALEREVDGNYTAYLREFTETTFIEVSLPPGRYRFHIVSYDILDRVEKVSRWENIEVRPAVKPEIYKAVPEFVSGDDEPSGYVISILGNDINPGAEFSIYSSDGTQIIPEVLDTDENGNARIFISSDKIIPGKYEIIIRNPGGLEDRIGGITLRMPEPEGGERMIILVGAAWTPVIPIHGNFFGESFSPASAAARAGAAFSIPRGLRLGVELTAFWHDNVLSAGLNLLAMKWLPNQKMSLNYRLGLSFIVLPDMPEKLMFNIGVSYLWRFTRKVFLETGLDYAGLLKEVYFDGCIRPWIGIGMVF